MKIIRKTISVVLSLSVLPFLCAAAVMYFTSRFFNWLSQLIDDVCQFIIDLALKIEEG